MTLARTLPLIWAALAFLASSGSAQQWIVDAQAGRVRSALDQASPTTETVALGLRYDAPTAALRLTAGIPLSTNEYVWGSLGAWKRAAVRHGPLLAGLDLSGTAFLLHDRAPAPAGPSPFPPASAITPPRGGHALAGQVLPVIGYETSLFQLQARAGVSRYSSEIGEQSTERTVQLADLQLTYAPTARVMLIPAVRWFRAAEEDATTFAGFTAALVGDRAAVWGSAGQWLQIEAGERTAWGAGASLKLHPRASLVASVRRDVYDPLYLSVPQTSWNVGLSVQFAGRVGPPPAPVPAAYVNGVATVRIPLSASRSAPSVAGDFNGWKPAPMRRVGGHWVYDVAIGPGVYQYAFVDQNGRWFVPEDVPGRKDDGMGGHVAVLVVR